MKASLADDHEVYPNLVSLVMAPAVSHCMFSCYTAFYKVGCRGAQKEASVLFPVEKSKVLKQTNINTFRG